MTIETSVAIIAFCFLFFTIVFVITLIILTRLALSAKKAFDNATILIQKIQANVEKAGTVIDDVKAAVESVKAAVDTFRNPFTTLISFLTGLMGIYFNKVKAEADPEKKKGGK